MRLILLSFALLTLLVGPASAQYTLTGWAKDAGDTHWQRQIGEKYYFIDILEGKIAYFLALECPAGSYRGSDVIVFSEENNFVPQHVDCDGSVTEETTYTIEAWLKDVGELPEEVTLYLLTH
jgi:hypothetical protein